MRLHYAPGSPFSRIVRILVRELNLACGEVEISGFPPSPEFFAINPLGQVPALETDDGIRFPTRLIIDDLLARPRRGTGAVAASVRRVPDCWQDEQLLQVLLLMGDALAAVKYQSWSGLRPVGENLVGYDPADRHMQRVQTTLDWLESKATPEGFLPDVLAVQDIALACFILWTEARGAIAWRGRRNLETIVDRLAARPSFRATQPQPWP